MNNRVIERLIGLISSRMNAQLNLILHHPVFQQLESSWRGLCLIVKAKSSDKSVVIRLLNVSLAELDKDLRVAIEFDHASIFRRLYSDEFDQPGGEPYGLIIANYALSHRPAGLIRDPVALLSRFSQLLAVAHLPCVIGIDASLLGLNSFSEIKVPLGLESLFQTRDYQRWLTLRNQEEMRYIGFVLPRILMRLPINVDAQNHRHGFFREIITHHDDYLWGNAVFAYGCVAIQSFKETGWFSETRGYSPTSHQGFALSLPRLFFDAKTASSMAKTVLEYRLTDAQEHQLQRYGLIGLKDHPLIEKTVFYSSQSFYRSKQYRNQLITQNSHLSSMLHYLLSVSRFIHTIKVMMRNKIGRFINVDDCERYLSNWIRRYCASGAQLSEEAKVRHPLNDAKIQITQQAGMEGKYYCVIHLKPHDQIDGMQAYLKAVTSFGGNEL